MVHSHTVPFDGVKLDGFVMINHSPVSDVYIALSEISLECEKGTQYPILALRPAFKVGYVLYEARYTTRRTSNPPAPYQFSTEGSLPKILDQLIKDLPDGTTLYLFGHQREVVTLPENCPKPVEINDFYPKLLAVVVKT